ncbi:DEKNAAC101120 [Brettanomyces naardenensis]|uniref:DEKNAAC101120 n=1 Tax=Brettanomyces naardenensis TaxID=13370 RepID=A0A448YHE3_BRENA|nr:DEKNAAC101120 [Brettanomyces naardenensis]
MTDEITQGIRDLNTGGGSGGAGGGRRDRRRRDLHAFANLAPGYGPAEGNFDPNAAASSVGITLPKANAEYPNAAFAAGGIPAPETTAGPPQGYPQVQPQYQAASPATSNVAPASASAQPPLSVPVLRHLSDLAYRDSPFLTFENVSPPPAGTQYVVTDQGNASPKFARMSLYSIPATRTLLDATSLPLGMLLQPFAPTTEPVPEADFTSASAVPRCRRCRAYVNPAMQQTGYQMVCNLCGFTSPVPNDYISTVDSAGVRSDFYQRPELHAGVYDLKVPKDYFLDSDGQPPNILHHVFLIDLCRSAVQSSLSVAACTAIQLAISSLPEGSKVALVGFDNALRFFDLSSSHHQASVSVVKDLKDPFVPLSSASAFADPKESYDVLEATLGTIEQVESPTAVEPALGSALLAADLLLQPLGGGQITVFLSTVPSLQPGALRPKLPQGRIALEYVRDILTPGNRFYLDLADKFTANHVGVNFFVGSSVPVDLINLSVLAARTGGTSQVWPHFNVDRDELDLAHAVSGSIRNAAGYQGQLKIRCSRGLQVSKVYQAMRATEAEGTASGSAPVFPIVGCQTTAACDFVYDGKLNTKKDAHFQAAMLYTGVDGVRRVRVINSIMSVTERVADVFSFADQDAVLSLLIRETFSRLPGDSIISVRNTFAARLVSIVSRYAAVVAKNNNAPGQLVLPRGLRTLPMMMLGALKARALASRTVSPDSTAESFTTLSTASADRVSIAVYPVMYALHRLTEGECEYAEKEREQDYQSYFSLPEAIPLSQAQLEAGGAYLLFDGKQMILWLHSEISPRFLQDLFGENINSLDQLDSKLSQLPVLDTLLSQQVRGLCHFLAHHYLGVEDHSVHICRFRTDQNEVDFLEKMYEDRSSELVWSFPELLRYIHKQVQAKRDEAPSESKRFGIF